MARAPGSPLDHWPSILERLTRAKHVALFLDFDGTLTPIRQQPDDVVVSRSTLRLLRRLAHRGGITVSVISGRRLADLRRRLRGVSVGCLGLHGHERSSGLPVKQDEREALRDARQLLVEGLTGLPRIWIEDKGLALAVHYRGAGPSLVQRAGAVVRRVLSPFSAQLKVLPGRKVWEVLPRSVKGKGHAVRAEMARLPRGAMPIYIGDDVTDEPAFAALTHGLTVCVSAKPRPTRARYCVRNPSEVRSFLERVDAVLEAGK